MLTVKNLYFGFESLCALCCPPIVKKIQVPYDIFSGYPLAVKLGTITKDGKGDVWSYVEDDMVEDPHLVKHLAHWGINVAVLEKVCC